METLRKTVTPRDSPSHRLKYYLQLKSKASWRRGGERDGYGRLPSKEQPTRIRVVMQI